MRKIHYPHPPDGLFWKTVDNCKENDNYLLCSPVYKTTCGTAITNSSTCPTRRRPQRLKPQVPVQPCHRRKKSIVNGIVNILTHLDIFDNEIVEYDGITSRAMA
jgi:hypothetical protein